MVVGYWLKAIEQLIEASKQIDRSISTQTAQRRIAWINTYVFQLVVGFQCVAGRRVALQVREWIEAVLGSLGV
jgi:hypothetical protein